MKPIINIDELKLNTYEHGSSFQASSAQVSGQIGAAKLGYSVSVLPPGKRAYPFHNHHANEEMFFVVSGSGQLRYGESVYPIRTGDFIAAPAGDRSTAHQIINNSAADLRYISISTMIRPEIVEYPDSNKFSASTAAPTAPAAFRQMSPCAPSLDYWHGEN